MLRKWICMLWAIVVVIGTGGQVQAAEQTGTVSIQPVWCGRQVLEGTVSLCRVGTKTGDRVNLSDSLANWQVKQEDLEELGWASWLAQKDLSDEIICQVGDAGAVFEGLSAGVYLVQQEEAGEYIFDPFFLTVPEGENWDVYRAPKLIRRGEAPRTGDRPTPLIGAMGIGLSVAFLMVFVDEHRK